MNIGENFVLDVVRSGDFISTIYCSGINVRKQEISSVASIYDKIDK